MGFIGKRDGLSGTFSAFLSYNSYKRTQELKIAKEFAALTFSGVYD